MHPVCVDNFTTIMWRNYMMYQRYVTTGAKPSGIPGNSGSLNSRSGIPGNFKSFWFVKKICAKFWQNTAKFVSFASVICITKAHKYASHLHTLQDSRTSLFTLHWCLTLYTVCQYIDVWFLLHADAQYWYSNGCLSMCLSRSGISLTYMSNFFTTW